MSKYTGTATLESMSQAKFYNRWTFDKFKSYLKGDILEIGCGIGSFTLALSEYGNVIAIDIDKSLIEKSQNEGNPRIISGYGDIEKGEYFFKNKAFDTIVCLNVLEHIHDDSKALNNIGKLLKKDGCLILLLPIYDFLYGEIDKSIGHFRRYNPEDLTVRIEKMGFKVIIKKKLNFFGALGWFIAGKILKNKHVESGKIRLFNFLAPMFLSIEDIIEPIIGTSILIIAKK